MIDFIPLKGYEDMESSTQMVIAEAQNRDFRIEIINREKNLIFISKDNSGHFIREATISEAVSSISTYLADDKWESKKILSKNNISCAKGSLFNKNFSLEDLDKIKFPVVVKPVDMSSGVGISINVKSKELLLKAIGYSLKFSDRAIVEDFFVGKEYRFLVIDYKLRAISNRDPANIVGDGIHDIKELIKKKNNSPSRKDDYTAPLLKIKIDDTVKDHLIKQKLFLSDVLNKEEKVYLKTNFNLSTGGDSIDVTDNIPSFYKNEAEKTAKILGLKIAGIDMMIFDIDAKTELEKNYIIVEVNSRPGLDVHHHCLSNKNRNIAKYVLDAILNS